MKILDPKQIRELDRFTVEKERLASSDLMERAAQACTERMAALCSVKDPVHIYCGCGNNGGDGLAMARLLAEKNYNVHVFLIRHNETLSEDAEKNLFRLRNGWHGALREIRDAKELEIVNDPQIVCVDALLGSGLNRPAEGILADVIDFINQHYKKVISIDVPSGLFCHTSSANNKHIVHASLCLTFQFPKLALLLPGNEKFAPEFEILNIGLDAEKQAQFDSSSYYVTINDVRSLIKKRSKFSHKGTYGHALLLAGSKGKTGAAMMAAKACLRSGAGLLTVRSTKDTILALQQFLPEAMSETDLDADCITDVESPENYEALAFGPGTGTAEQTAQTVKKLLNYFNGRLVLDADGLNILSENKTWLDFLPEGCILTPHLREFERLSEKTTDDFERLNLLKQFSVRYNCIVVLKGAHSCIAMPDGNLFFNSSGNPAMAKGGSGDVLTGIILGLLSRGYNSPQAALIGTFVHGLAADLCAEHSSKESILATDVIEMLGKAFHILEEA